MAFHETIAADETSRFEGYANELKAIQSARAAKKGSTARALHVKQHLGVVGEWTTSAPDNLKKGVFAENKTYPCYVRFSNGSSAHQGDKAPDARGFAVKVVGVDGKKIIPGLEGKKTQDFLFVGEPALPFRDPEEFMKFVRAAKDGPRKLLPRLFGSFGLGRAFSLIRRLAKSPKIHSMATHPFYTAAPIAFGDTACKLAVIPGTTGGDGVAGDDHYRDDLVSRLQSGPLTWTVRAQLFVDDATTPVEDTSVVWPSPWVDVGKLVIPKQDPSSPAGKAVSELCETFSFDPWHSIEAHRPLGAIMRARAVAYRESVLARKAADEPDTVLPAG
jgi:hypothetical protein